MFSGARWSTLELHTPSSARPPCILSREQRPHVLSTFGSAKPRFDVRSLHVGSLTVGGPFTIPPPGEKMLTWPGLGRGFSPGKTRVLGCFLERRLRMGCLEHRDVTLPGVTEGQRENSRGHLRCVPPYWLSHSALCAALGDTPIV